MNGKTYLMEDICRTCLCYFTENSKKYSLVNCSAVSDCSDRLELMKNVMKNCSLTLFQNEEDPEVFICTSCVNEIDKMLTFLEKCIRSEVILKQAAEVKIEGGSVWADEVHEGNENPFHPKIEIKVEGFNQDSSCSEAPGFVECDPDDIPLSLYSKMSKNNNEETKHECQECHKIFSSALSLAFHKYKHVGYKPHICVICNATFQNLHLIKKHMAAEHDNTRYQPYLCKQCPEIFTTKHHLTKHKHRRHNTKIYSCNACKRTFSTISSLKYHENIHLELRSYSCTFCSKSFTSASVLKDHKKSSHSENKKFDCYCGRSFNRKKKLELHIDSVHEKKDKLRKYHCPECDKKFRHPHALKNHINAHLGIKPFLCNVCGSSFTALSNLTSHFRRLHSGEKQPVTKMYLCHNCGDSFARASHLKRHTLRKHVPNAEKKYECPICNKKFLEKSDVTGHVKLHDDSKPYTCDQCSKCFRTAWRLQAHVNRVHLGLRPFECPTCSVKFKTKSHLEKHIRTHTGEKPFPCPHCAYTCAEKSNLKKHINIHLKAM